MHQLPAIIDSGNQGKFHVQGICLDRERQTIYYSFTTSLVKSDLSGRVIGSVRGLTGHLGCIAMGPDGKVYGSLEYKNDAIGQGILARMGRGGESHRDGFYVAVFDVDRIDRLDMDAEADGIMQAVYLNKVVEDYHAQVVNAGKPRLHRHGCSGIDGITFAPLPGGRAGDPLSLYVAYGVYSDLDRTDNDYQVLLRYDTAGWDSFLQPLKAEDPHTSGPQQPDNIYYIYTGNTQWGVQNLEYDPYTNHLFLAVYPGLKSQFPNHPLYVADMGIPARLETLQGVEPPLKGLTLTLWGEGSLPGFDFPLGSTGLFSLGDGRFYACQNLADEAGNQSARVALYRYNGQAPLLFEAL